MKIYTLHEENPEEIETYSCFSSIDKVIEFLKDRKKISKDLDIEIKNASMNIKVSCRGYIFRYRFYIVISEVDNIYYKPKDEEYEEIEKRFKKEFM